MVRMRDFETASGVVLGLKTWPVEITGYFNLSHFKGNRICRGYDLRVCGCTGQRVGEKIQIKSSDSFNADSKKWCPSLNVISAQAP